MDMYGNKGEKVLGVSDLKHFLSSKKKKKRIILVEINEI